jgi:hypothetical protein
MQQQIREDYKILQKPYLKQTTKQTNMNHSTKWKWHISILSKHKSKKDLRPEPCYLLTDTIPSKPKASPQNQAQALSLAKIQ